MKKTLFVALMVVAGFAQATVFAGKNEYAGRCAALQLQVGNSSTARVAMNVATNKGEMQIAAREWMSRLARDEKGAVKSGVMACQLIGITM